MDQHWMSRTFEGPSVRSLVKAEASSVPAGLDYEASVMACAKGDRSALQSLFEQESGRLIGVARRIVRRSDLAEEVVQDAFVQIWRKAEQFNPQFGSAKGWIYTIVRNRALNVIRDHSREELADEADLETMRHDDQVVDDAYQRLDTNSRLRLCLDRLDQDRKTCVLLAYVAGFSHGEIAGKLGVPLGTAKSWIRRSLSSLKECLG
jgi:RNA polymerase sigma-70 factor (ECF subfamily)